jgi:tRNA-Thr(GGU) m(6)t(6)A37 methyltransferase TsaA
MEAAACPCPGAAETMGATACPGTTSDRTPLQAVIAEYEKTLAAERALRAQAERALAAARSAALWEHGYPLFPIGTVESALHAKRGAPRQGSLAPSVRARVRLAPSLDLASLDGLQDYSHIWLLYLFHDDEARAPGAGAAGAPPWAAAGRCIAPKVLPPGLGGARTGVFSTRSPHRPNSIALTLCALEGVDRTQRILLLSGCDAIAGSPVFDVKPYLPRADAPAAGAALRMPRWVAAPLEAQAPLGVSFATPQLEEACRHAVDAGACSFYAPGEGSAFLAALGEVLALDTRSVHQGRGSRGSGGHVTSLAAALAAAERAGGGGEGSGSCPAGAGRPVPYVIQFDAVRVEFTYLEQGVSVTGVEVVRG